MSKLLRNLIAPAAIVLLTTACATGSARSDFTTGDTDRNAPVTVPWTHHTLSDPVI